MLKKVFVPVFVLLLVACQGDKIESDENNNGTQVEVVKAEKESARSFLEFSGLLQPVSQVAVFPEVMGKVESIVKFEGNEVRKGDVLARIEQTDYQIGFDQADAAFDLAKANLKNNESNYKRQVDLNKNGFSSQAALDGMETAYKIATAQFNQAKAARDMATRQLERTQITSPIDGYIASRSIDTGQQVSGGGPAFTIQNLHQLKVNLSVSESGLSSISTKSKVVIYSDNLPGKTYSGKVVFISRSASQDGGFPVKVELDNSDLSLLSGWTVTIEIYQPEANKLVTIPGKAIMKKSGRWVAFTVEEDNAVEKQIELMTQIRDKVYIRSGIDEGDVVIVRGQEYCNSGDAVNVSREWIGIDEFLQENHH